MALTNQEKNDLMMEIAIGNKKLELSNVRRKFQSQLNFMNKKNMAESFYDKVLNNACHWESEIERLNIEIDILSNVDDFNNFIPESQREETIYEVWHKGKIEFHTDPYIYG